MNAQKIKVNVNNEEVTVWRILNDVNGNPRYVVHFLALGYKNYENEERKQKGLKLYKAKWFGGGYVFTSYNVEESLKRMVSKNFNK